VEAYHAGTIRTILYQNQGQQAFNSPKLLVRDVVQAISNLRDAVDGEDDIDQGIVTFVPPFFYVANIVPTDENALVYTRNTSQVRWATGWWKGAGIKGWMQLELVQCPAYSSSVANHIKQANNHLFGNSMRMWHVLPQMVHLA
jgi:hypothetical protein